MADQVGIAVLGCGYWGINYVRVFSEMPEARVVVVCDQRPDRLEEIGRRFPGVQLTTQVEEALTLPRVDAAIVCTEAKTHYEVARRCLLAGKHVLVEKPVTTTASDAEALAVLDQGQVGRVYYLYARRTNLGPIRRDVNALWDLAPHDVSIFNYLLDSIPEWVSAVGAKVLKNCREDVGFISLGYRDGIVGHIHVSWAEPNKVREVVVVGSDKRIVFDDLNPLERVRVFDKGVMPVAAEPTSYGEYQFLMRDGDITSPRVEVSEPLRNQCSHFLECIDRGSQPLTNGRTGRDVVRVMEAIDRSIDRKGAPVEVEAAYGESYGYREVGATDTLR